MVDQPNLNPSPPRGLRLGQLLNVSNAVPTDGYALIYETATGRWKAKQVATAGLADGSVTFAKLASDVGTGFDSRWVNVTGDTMTGALALPSNGLNVGSGQLNVTGANVLISGSASVGGATDNSALRLNVAKGGNLTVPTLSAADVAVVQNATATTNTNLIILSANTQASQLLFGDTDSKSVGNVSYDHSTDAMSLITNSAVAVTITSGGQLLATAGTNPVYSRIGDTSSGLTLSGSGVVELVGGGNRTVRIQNSALGFYGTVPVGRPDVTGSRGGNAALADLLADLAALGLITNSTTA